VNIKETQHQNQKSLMVQSPNIIKAFALQKVQRSEEISNPLKNSTGIFLNKGKLTRKLSLFERRMQMKQES
jgi:hypothetical protein